MAYSSFPSTSTDRDFAAAVHFGGYRAATHATTNPLQEFKEAMDKVIAEEDVWFYKDNIIDDLTTAVVMSADSDQAEIRLYSNQLSPSYSFRVPYALRTHTVTYILAILRNGLQSCGFSSTPPEVW